MPETSAMIYYRLTDVSLILASIVTIGDLSHHCNLQELDLGHNGIEEIQGLSSLKCLRVLRLNNNKIREINGIDGEIESCTSR